MLVGLCQNIIVNVSKRLKPVFLDPYFQFCKYSHASKCFAYLYKLINLDDDILNYWYIAPQMEHSFSFLKFYLEVSSP